MKKPVKQDHQLFTKRIDAHPMTYCCAVILVAWLATLLTTTDAVRHLHGLDVGTCLAILAGFMALVIGSPTALAGTMVTTEHESPGQN